tara:strand:+ start:318 stop:473 length:156 start_codon:yes stop_codon:yes gene_type:complete
LEDKVEMVAGKRLHRWGQLELAHKLALVVVVVAGRALLQVNFSQGEMDFPH